MLVITLTLVALLQCLTLHVPSATAFSMKMAASANNGRVVFGTAAISNAENPFEVLDSAYAKGVRRFDLARTYGHGASEALFGEWLVARGINRRSIHIITKGGMGDDKYGDPTRALLTRQCLMEEIDASLDALKVQDVDMYMFHRDDPRIPVGQFVTWANEIIEQGKAFSWGVSNWSFERFQQAHDFARKEGLRPPTANSPQLSLASPACEVWPTTYTVSGDEYKHQLDWYQQNGVELVCWEVLAKGFMAVPDLWSEETIDRTLMDKEVEIGTDEWRLQRIQRAYCTNENWRRRRNALKVAEDFGMTLAQVAALYAMSVSPCVSVILGFLEPNQIDDVADLHHYIFDNSCVVGDGEEDLDTSNKLFDLREIRHDNLAFTKLPSNVAKKVLA